MPRIPAYERIREAVRADARQLGAGGRLPSETTLAERFGVTRVTVRQALAGLEAEGTVVREHGRGTFVRDVSPTPRPLSRLTSFGQDIKGQGLDLETEVVSAEEVDPPQQVAEALAISSPGRSIYVCRLRRVGGRPLAVQKVWLPAAMFPGIVDQPFLNDSLYDTLERRYFVQLRRAEQQIGAVSATRELADLLDIPQRSPLLHIERLTFDESGRRIEFALSWTRPEYELSAVLER